jgi:hypothetical protein
MPPLGRLFCWKNLLMHQSHFSGRKATIACRKSSDLRERENACDCGPSEFMQATMLIATTKRTRFGGRHRKSYRRVASSTIDSLHLTQLSQDELARHETLTLLAKMINSIEPSTANENDRISSRRGHKKHQSLLLPLKKSWAIGLD